MSCQHYFTLHPHHFSVSASDASQVFSRTHSPVEQASRKIRCAVDIQLAVRITGVRLVKGTHTAHASRAGRRAGCIVAATARGAARRLHACGRGRRKQALGLCDVSARECAGRIDWTGALHMHPRPTPARPPSRDPGGHPPPRCMLLLEPGARFQRERERRVHHHQQTPTSQKKSMMHYARFGATSSLFTPGG